MIEISSKVKNFIFWISLTSVSLIVFGIFIIDIFVTDAKGKDKLSIIFSYLSTVFAFLSALALFATIVVYFWQKNDSLKMQKERDDIVKRSLSAALNSHETTILNIMDFAIDDFETKYKKIMIEQGKHISCAFIALDCTDELIQYQPVHIEHGGFINESMRERHSCSSSTAQLVEEINYFTEELTKFIKNVVIDKLSNDKFPIRMKLIIIKDFSNKKGKYFLNEINKLKKRI